MRPSLVLPAVLASTLGCQAAPAASGPQPPSRPATAAAPNTIPVPDAALNGLSEGDLYLLPGWHGAAHVDRTADPINGGIAILAASVTSPDGQSNAQQLPIGFHTVAPQMAEMLRFAPPQARSLLAAVAFSSTADLLARYIVPALGLGGSPSAPVPTMTGEKRAEADREAAKYNIPGPIVDSAYVLVTGLPNGQEALVSATSIGGGRNTPQENSITYINVLRAPAGRALALFHAGEQLPPLATNPEWARADQQRAEQQLAASEAQNRQFNQQQQQNQQAQFAQGQARMASQRQQFDEHNAAWARQQQRNTDSSALFRGYLSSSNVSYKWCGPNGDVQYVTNSTTSPGAGYTRCQ